jgi:hypothetical protein
LHQPCYSNSPWPWCWSCNDRSQPSHASAEPSLPWSIPLVSTIIRHLAPSALSSCSSCCVILLALLCLGSNYDLTDTAILSINHNDMTYSNGLCPLCFWSFRSTDVSIGSPHIHESHHRPCIIFSVQRVRILHLLVSYNISPKRYLALLVILHWKAYIFSGALDTS